jgi:hypothetical protein
MSFEREALDKQLTDIRALLTSPEWLVWANFLKKVRRGYLRSRVEKAVREGNIIEAQIAQALLDDCEKQLELFGGYIKDIEKTSKGEKA